MLIAGPITHFARSVLMMCSAGVVLALQLVERRRVGERLDPRRLVPLAMLLEGIPEAVFLFDRDGLIVDCNQAAEQLCGRPRASLLNVSIVEFNHLLSARDEYDQFVTPPTMGVNRALTGEVVREVRRVFRHPSDMHVVDTVTSASPIRESDGSINGVLLIVRDVTQLSQLSQRLADAQRHREVGQMAAGLAHDFGNVLDTILQATDMLETCQLENRPEKSSYAEMIRRAASHGADIIGRVREYLRTGAEGNTAVNLTEITREVVELARPLWYRRRGLRVTTRLQPVPMVLGNASDLRRMFTNLVINGLDAMPDGGELTISSETVGQHARIVISDTGQGVPPDEQKLVFMPYYTTKPHGTGLGLSGAQRLVTALHGRIQFHSTVGKGTSVVVELPVPSASDVHPSPA